MCRKCISVSEVVLNFSSMNSSISRLAAVSSSNCWSCNVVVLVIRSNIKVINYHRTAVEINAGEQTVLINDRPQRPIINKSTTCSDRTLQAMNLFQPCEPISIVVACDHGRQCVLAFESCVPYLGVLAQHEHVTSHTCRKKYIQTRYL